MPLGDVVRVTYASDGSSNLLHQGEHAWGIISSTTGKYEDHIKWLTYVDRLQRDCPFLDDRDEFEVVDPDDWPEEVCIAVAKYQLTGEV